MVRSQGARCPSKDDYVGFSLSLSRKCIPALCPTNRVMDISVFVFSGIIVAIQSVVSSSAALSSLYCWLFSIALKINSPSCGTRSTDALEYVKAGSRKT